MDRTITLTVNGARRTLVTDAERSLLHVLREDLDITGPKYGCGQGDCGACTVLVDGERTLACVTPAVEADGKTVTTIEGLADGDLLHPVQQAFLDEGAVQCGYCTPGMVLSAVALLKRNPRPSEAEIVAWMDGNVCRCNGYVKIVAAIRRAAGGEGR